MLPSDTESTTLLMVVTMGGISTFGVPGPICIVIVIVILIASVAPAVGERRRVCGSVPASSSVIVGGSAAKEESNLDSLIGGIGGAGDILSGLPSIANPASNQTNNAGGSNLLDLLGDLDFSGGNNAQPAMPSLPTTNPAPAMQSNNLLDGLVGLNSGTNGVNNNMDILSGLSSMPSTKTASNPTLNAYNANGVNVNLVIEENANCEVKICMEATTGQPVDVTDFMFQAAVPKSMTLELREASSTVISLGEKVTQQMKVGNPTKAPVKMRVKMSYRNPADGQVVNYQGDLGNFPPQM